MKPATKPASARPIWQNALLARGCQLRSGGDLFPLELRPVGECLVCVPVMGGLMVPFNVEVKVGESVTISWDPELSRYIIITSGSQVAA